MFAIFYQPFLEGEKPKTSLTKAIRQPKPLKSIKPFENDKVRACLSTFSKEEVGRFFRADYRKTTAKPQRICQKISVQEAQPTL